MKKHVATATEEQIRRNLARYFAEEKRKSAGREAKNAARLAKRELTTHMDLSGVLVERAVRKYVPPKPLPGWKTKKIVEMFERGLSSRKGLPTLVRG